MVQGMSVSTLTTSRNCGIYGSKPLCRNHSKMYKSQMGNSAFEGHCLWHQNVLRLYLTSHCNRLKQRNVKVEAGWLFKGSDRTNDASSERSESANEDILIFFFQLDLATRVQCALNMEQYEIAQQLRNKLTEVEAEVIKQQDFKRGSTAKSEAQDKAISILRLRTDMQKAIESENYALAAELRDKISKLEAESLAASAKALAYENVRYAFRLGQKVRHKIFGYRGVICGMDPVCCESSSWMENAHVTKLSRGNNQPFYQVLVDVYADPNLLVTYVSEENLLAPDQADKERFDHPYISFLFYGMDTAGDFIPIKQLREKYNKPRHEVDADPQDEDN
ncbi:Clp protease adapter protein clpf protein [Thalictrum thalictroides]|uniref:Clp protease adapter protein clpf protein n=1 Tax=Thalictrum thalictroides TaxID=46969 RepID=A0A7J6X172_THATH|nr:Clp protease adapter protein clpf protein [Thalictrum thalictroides]